MSAKHSYLAIVWHVYIASGILKVRLSHPPKHLILGHVGIGDQSLRRVKQLPWGTAAQRFFEAIRVSKPTRRRLSKCLKRNKPVLMSRSKAARKTYQTAHTILYALGGKDARNIAIIGVCARAKERVYIMAFGCLESDVALRTVLFCPNYTYSIPPLIEYRPWTGLLFNSGNIQYAGAYHTLSYPYKWPRVQYTSLDRGWQLFYLK